MECRGFVRPGMEIAVVECRCCGMSWICETGYENSGRGVQVLWNVVDL